MAVETAKDRANFIADFGEVVFFTGDYGTIGIMAIFDAEYVAVGPGDTLVSTNGPMLTCVSADIIDVGQGDIVEIRSTNYKVFDIRPDGTGITLLDVKKV
jgi:hypothetical protein